MIFALQPEADCWNRVPLYKFAKQVDALHTEIQSSPHLTALSAGRIACMGCRRTERGDWCTAEITMPSLELHIGKGTWQILHAPTPEAIMSDEKVAGFQLFKPPEA